MSRQRRRIIILTCIVTCVVIVLILVPVLISSHANKTFDKNRTFHPNTIVEVNRTKNIWMIPLQGSLPTEIQMHNISRQSNVWKLHERETDPSYFDPK